MVVTQLENLRTVNGAAALYTLFGTDVVSISDPQTSKGESFLDQKPDSVPIGFVYLTDDRVVVVGS